jgi:hypothetical protein
MDGVSHTVEVTAATLYEAVAQGIAQGLNVVKVSVEDVCVEHEVKLMGFTQWLERAGGSLRNLFEKGGHHDPIQCYTTRQGAEQSRPLVTT